jgi:hypothetical protein
MVKKDRKYSDERYRLRTVCFHRKVKPWDADPDPRTKVERIIKNKPQEKIINTQTPTHIELGGSVYGQRAVLIC